MSATANSALARLVHVLDLQTQHAQSQMGAAQVALQRTQTQMAKLEALREEAQLKKTKANVALYANAAGFRSSLMDVAQQFRDAHGVQQLALMQAKQQVQQAMRRQASVSGVLEQQKAAFALAQSRQAQKRMDELAGQAWQRQRSAFASPR